MEKNNTPIIGTIHNIDDEGNETAQNITADYLFNLLEEVSKEAVISEQNRVILTSILRGILKDKKLLDNFISIYEGEEEALTVIEHLITIFSYLNELNKRPSPEQFEKILANYPKINTFLETLSPTKIKRRLPGFKMTPQEEGDLDYTYEERQKLETGSKEEKAQVKAARRERAKHFLSGLTIAEIIKITKKSAPRQKKDPSKKIPNGTAIGVNEYVTTKDLLSKAVFGEPGRDGKILSLMREKEGALRLWTTGKGKNTQEVVLYTRLEPNEKSLAAAGITIGKNLSKCAREVYGALLSHYLAGNSLLSVGMVGKIIFNVRDGYDLTEAQRNYIVNGANELFLTTLYADTTRNKIDENGNKEKGYISLQEAQNIKITRAEQVFPGRITSAYINGSLVETAIELTNLPTLYTLQNALEKGQILRAPIDILKIPGRMDEDVVTIRAFLLKRIDAMKHSNLSRMIIYKNILDEVGVDPTDRGQKDRRSRILKKVERVLNYWKEEGYIHDYTKLAKSGKPIKGTASIYKIEIML